MDSKQLALMRNILGRRAEMIVNEARDRPNANRPIDHWIRVEWVNVDRLGAFAVLCAAEQQTRIAEKMHAESRAMTRLTWCVFGLTLLMVVLVGVQTWAVLRPTPLPPPVTEITQREFKVLRVIDGDTFVVMYDGEKTSVRIWGIAAPERGEPGFAEARDELRERIEGRTVRLTFPGPRKRDHFGRLLATIDN